CVFYLSLSLSFSGLSFTIMCFFFFFFQAEDGIRDLYVTGVQTCALPIYTFLGQQKRNYRGNRHDPQKGINDQPALAKTDRQEIPHCETLLFLVRVSVQCSFDHCFDLTALTSLLGETATERPDLHTDRAMRLG